MIDLDSIFQKTRLTPDLTPEFTPVALFENKSEHRKAIIFTSVAHGYFRIRRILVVS
jgi:hypothetical protein